MDQVGSGPIQRLGKTPRFLSFFGRELFRDLLKNPRALTHKTSAKQNDGALPNR